MNFKINFSKVYYSPIQYRRCNICGEYIVHKGVALVSEITKPNGTVWKKNTIAKLCQSCGDDFKFNQLWNTQQ